MTIGTVPARTYDPVQAIDAIVEEYRRQTRTPGVSVAVHYPEYFGESGIVLPYGLAHLHPVVKVDADTIFGLGSVTKVFTSLLLAYAVEKGYAKLTDPAINYLSRQYGATGSPAFNAIQLRALATHTSGMADQAKGVKAPGDQLFADKYPSSEMLDYWTNYQRPDGPVCWQYSNTAFVTLGFAITAMYPALPGNQYDRLLQEYVTGPLSMANTNASPGESLFAKGYNRDGGQQTPAKIVAADLKSNASDLLILLKAYLGRPSVDSVLSRALALTTAEQGDFPICQESGKTMRMGLAWQIPSVNGHRLYTKDGSTAEGGFSCMVEFAPEMNFGIAVLTNQVWHDAPKEGVNNPGALAKALRESLVPELSQQEPLATSSTIPCAAQLPGSMHNP